MKRGIRKSDFFLAFIEYLLRFSNRETFSMSKIDFLSFMNRQKISQMELAEALDVHQSAVSQYVSGKSGVVFDKVEKLVDLGITPEELFGETTGKKMRDAIIKDYLSQSGEVNPNSFDVVKEGLIEILKRI
jgi:transcriptional regulator with XRE-family HTH domain